MPQARFWMAIAMPQASRVSPRSVLIGSVSSPKLVRMPLVTAAMMQPQMISTTSGVATERGAVIEDIAGDSGNGGACVLTPRVSITETHFADACDHAI